MKDANKNLPRFLLLENVPSLLAERHFDNFKIWIFDLEKLGYRRSSLARRTQSRGKGGNGTTDFTVSFWMYDSGFPAVINTVGIKTSGDHPNG